MRAGLRSVHAVLLPGSLAWCLTACAAGSEDADALVGAAATDVTTRAPSSLASTGGSANEPDSDVVKIKVSVRDGKVRPSFRRVEVDQGAQVHLTVTSDVADEVHVHGADAAKPLRPGNSTVLQFRIREPGVFAVETHASGLELLQLAVR